MSVMRADSSDFDAAVAGADLSAKLFYLAKLNTSGQAILATSGDVVYGVITEVAESGKTATLQVSGIAKVVLGGSVNAGVRCMSDGNGKAVTATATKNVFGVCRKGGSAGEIGEFLIDRSFVET